MKEKQKRRPHRHFYPFIILLLILIGGYFAFPLAQNAFTNWWEDDPFTQRCAMPEYTLAINNGSSPSLLYDISPNANPQTLDYYYLPWFFSPDGRWFRDEQAGTGQIIDTVTNQPVFSYEAKYGWDIRWLYDNRLLYKDELTAQLRLYDPQNNSLEILAIGLGAYLISFPPSAADNYFLASEEIFAANERQRGLVLYDRELNRKVLHTVTGAEREETVFWGYISPDARFYAYELRTNNSRQLWLIDFQQEDPQPIHIADTSIAELTWSPNSDYLAYSSREDTQLYFYEIASQKTVFNYQGSLQSIKMIEWSSNGFWLQEDAALGTETRLSWGSFDGINMELHRVVGGRAKLINTLNSSDNLMIATWQANGNFIDGLQLLSPEDGVIFRVPDSLEGLPNESPDNRYLLYHRNNEWLYILNLETMQSCRAVQLEKNRNNRVMLDYYWHASPQS